MSERPALEEGRNPGGHLLFVGRFRRSQRAVGDGVSGEGGVLVQFFEIRGMAGGPGADPHAKWVIGFVGETPVSDELSRLVEGKNVLGRDLQVRKFQAADNPRACNILFISESEKKRLPGILAALRGSNVLTVADMDGFLNSGGMVAFVVEDSRVKVAIDVAATGRAKLKVSSKLLALAHVVSGPDRGASN